MLPSHITIQLPDRMDEAAANNLCGDIDELLETRGDRDAVMVLCIHDPDHTPWGDHDAIDLDKLYAAQAGGVEIDLNEITTDDRWQALAMARGMLEPGEGPAELFALADRVLAFVSGDSPEPVAPVEPTGPVPAEA